MEVEVDAERALAAVGAQGVVVLPVDAVAGDGAAAEEAGGEVGTRRVLDVLGLGVDDHGRSPFVVWAPPRPGRVCWGWMPGR